MNTYSKIAGALIVAAGLHLAPPAIAGDVNGHYVTGASVGFDDAVTDLESAIVNRGLVVDYTGQIGNMLDRTGKDTDSETPYGQAIYMQFCSAKFTHEAVAKDPKNIAVCPFVVFAYTLKDKPDEVMVGYRDPHGSAGSEDATDGIRGLLREIVDEVAQ